jgi:hypothetical protein
MDINTDFIYLRTIGLLFEPFQHKAFERAAFRRKLRS